MKKPVNSKDDTVAANIWNDAQVFFPATIVPIMILCHQTHLTNFSEERKVLVVFFTIGI